MKRFLALAILLILAMPIYTITNSQQKSPEKTLTKTKLLEPNKRTTENHKIEKNRHTEERIKPQQYGYSWAYSELEYRIPIIIENIQNYSYSGVPVKVHFDFLDSPTMPYNTSLLMTVGDNLIDFQIVNYVSNGTHLESFDLIFVLDQYYTNNTIFYLYFSPNPRDLSSYGTSDYYGTTYNLPKVDTININKGNMYLFITNNTEPWGTVWYLSVVDGIDTFVFLLSKISQNTGNIGESYACKTGLINITESRGQLLGLPMKVNDSTLYMGDLEDTLNGPFRVISNAFYVYNSSGLKGVYSPLLENATSISIVMGQVYVEVSFINVPLMKYYTEGAQQLDLPNVLSNVTFEFYRYSRRYSQSITLKNLGTETLFIDDNSTSLGGLTNSTYGAYKRFSVSPQDVGTTFQIFSWFDDPDNPGGTYSRIGSTNGIPTYYGWKRLDNTLLTYATWTNNSQGRNPNFADASIIIRTQDPLKSISPIVESGAYLIINSSSQLYDGLAFFEGFDFPMRTLNANSFTTYSADIIVSYASDPTNFEAKIRFLAGEIHIINSPDAPSNIQYKNSIIEITMTKLYSQYYNLTDGSLSLYYNNSYVPCYNVTTIYLGEYTYRVYYYSVAVLGTFLAVITKDALPGPLNYSTNITVESINEKVNVTLPIVDFEVNLYDPTEPYLVDGITHYSLYYNYDVWMRLIASNYTNDNTTIDISVYYEQAVVKNLILGKYNLTMVPNIYSTLGIYCGETMSITLTWSNTTFFAEAYADVAVVHFIGFDSEGNRLSHFTVNVSGFHSSKTADSYEGVATVYSVPLSNRSDAQGVKINVTVEYPLFGSIKNTTEIRVDSTNITISLVLSGVHTLFVDIYSSAGELISMESYRINFYLRNATDNYYSVAAILNDTYFIISVPDTQTYNLDLTLNVTYETYGIATIISNATPVGSVTAAKHIKLVIPVIRYLSISVSCFDGYTYFTPRGYVNIRLATLDGSYSWESFESNELYVNDIPSQLKFNLSVFYYTYLGVEIRNMTILSFNSSYYEVILRLRDLPVYVVPQYNQSEFLPGVSVDIFLNNTYVASGITNKFGSFNMTEFPSPVYGYVNLTIYYYYSIYGYYISGRYQIFVNQSIYRNEIVVPLPLHILNARVVSPEGKPMSGAIDIYAGDYFEYMGTIKISEGIGTFSKIPTNNVSLVIIIDSVWGYSLVMRKSVVLEAPNITAVFVAPLNTSEILVKTQYDAPIAGAKVVLGIYGGDNSLIGTPIGYTEMDGLAVIDEIPPIGVSLLVNGSWIDVSRISIMVSYQVLQGKFVYVESTLDSLRTTVSLPLGTLSLEIVYNSSEGIKSVRGEALADLFVWGQIYRRINLSETSAFDFVPINVSMLIYITYRTETGTIVSKTINYVLDTGSENLRVVVPIGDLELDFVDMDGVYVGEINVTLRSTGFVVTFRISNGSYTLERIPYGSYELIVSAIDCFGNPFYYSKTMSFLATEEKTIKLGFRSLTLKVYGDDRNPLNGLFMAISYKNYQMNVTTKTNIFRFDRLQLAVYIIDIYYLYGNALLPLNYSRYPLDLGSTPNNLDLYASLTELRSDVVMESRAIYQNTKASVSLYVYDSSGNAITGLNIIMKIVNGSDIMAVPLEETSPGYYGATFDVGSLRHGTYSVTFYIHGDKGDIPIAYSQVIIMSLPPQISFNLYQYIVMAVIVLSVSIALSIVQYRLSKLAKKHPGKNLKYLMTMYILGVFLTLGILAVGYLGLLDAGYQIVAYSLSFVLIVMLYGLWIYMDGYRAIKLKRSSKLSIIFGLVHLLIPILIMMQILNVGGSIEWFEEYILENTTSLGPIIVPSLFASFVSAYLTTYLVVVITAYRDIGKSYRRIVEFDMNNVPDEILEKESSYQLARLSSSIRIKILIFLGLIGLSVITALPFLKTVSLLIIVVPIVLLIIGPYIGYVLTDMITRESR